MQQPRASLATRRLWRSRWSRGGVMEVACGLRLGVWWFPTHAANGAAWMGHPVGLMLGEKAEADSMRGIACGGRAFAVVALPLIAGLGCVVAGGGCGWGFSGIPPMPQTARHGWDTRWG